MELFPRSQPLTSAVAELSHNRIGRRTSLNPPSPAHAARALSTPEKSAVTSVDTGESLSHATPEERSARLSDALPSAGLQTGDVVGLGSANSVTIFEVYRACLRSGFYRTTVRPGAGRVRRLHGSQRSHHDLHGPMTARPGSVGTAKLGMVCICDDEGNEVPTGQSGVVYFERDVTPFAYHHHPDKTAAARRIHRRHLLKSCVHY